MRAILSLGASSTTERALLNYLISRLHIMKAACGLHHSILVSEAFGPSLSVAPDQGAEGGAAGQRR